MAETIEDFLTARHQTNLLAPRATNKFPGTYGNILAGTNHYCSFLPTALFSNVYTLWYKPLGGAMSSEGDGGRKDRVMGGGGAC